MGDTGCPVEYNGHISWKLYNHAGYRAIKKVQQRAITLES